MALSNFLSNHVKNQAQVVALDPRIPEQVTSNRKYVRVLQISDLLSRSMEVDKILEIFTQEIMAEIPHSGYVFECKEIDVKLSQGKPQDFSVNYRLRIQNRQLGEITLFRPSAFTSNEICELEDLLCSLIYPIQNALMYQIALLSAYRDPLTGLNNRTSMEKFLPREIDLANRHQHPMALLVMDLDGFKQINDSFGHDMGDRVLRDVGKVLTDAVRNTDLLYRYGGDEFVGGLAQTDLQGGLDVSERIRCNIENLEFPGIASQVKIKVSIGITLVRNKDTFERVFKRADKALYQAKLGGKNRIVVD